MDGNFNAQILVDKLSKLNNSQQSIETLSHWCIFHRKKARQVVETWDSQFHCSPQDQRISFLYLANDILQNSRWKGSEFVAEFWKVLPGALSDVLENGDGFGRNAASRLIDIWEERKVFGSRGQTLKEELLGRKQENNSRNGNFSQTKLKNVLEKLILSYEHVYNGSLDEDSVLNKCKAGITCIEHLEKERENNLMKGTTPGSQVMSELQEQHGLLRESIQQLKVIESSRVALVSRLREALHEQEFKLELVRNQLQAAQARSEHDAGFSGRVVQKNNGQMPLEHCQQEAKPFPYVSPSSIQRSLVSTREKETFTPVMYTQQGSFSDKNAPDAEVDGTNNSSSEAAAKLVTPPSLSQIDETYASETKRPKVENDRPHTPPHPQEQPPPPPPTFPHPDLDQQMTLPQPTTYQQTLTPMPHPGRNMQLLPLQPPQPPMQQQPPPPSQFMQMTTPYGYGPARPPQWPPSPYPTLASMVSYPTPPPNPYPVARPPENGGYFSHPPLAPIPPPISRQ